jgi:hypothetical protein
MPIVTLRGASFPHALISKYSSYASLESRVSRATIFVLDLELLGGVVRIREFKILMISLLQTVEELRETGDLD